MPRFAHWLPRTTASAARQTAPLSCFEPRVATCTFTGARRHWLRQVLDRGRRMGSGRNGAKIGTNDRTAQAPPLQVGQSLVFVEAMLASSHAPRAASRNQTTKPLILAPFGSRRVLLFFCAPLLAEQ